MSKIALYSFAKKSYRPISLYNPQNVIDKYNWWNKHLPSIKPYYAIKSFNERVILNTLSSFDIGFDVASKQEIQQSVSYNKPLILSHPIKSKEDILFAKEKNVKRIVCDSIDEAYKITSLYPSSELIWRIKSFEDFSSIKFNTKYGASFEETKKILKQPLNIKGISFHVGSKCLNMNAYTITINNIINNIHPLFIKNNKSLSLIDIGGGFNDKNDIVSLKKEYKQFEHYFKTNNITCISEPGRYFSKSCLTLYTKVLSVKNYKDHAYIYINDSIYNTFSGKVFDHQEYFPSSVISFTKNKNKEKLCTIFGNTCDGEDKIVENIKMRVPNVGELVEWKNMGANGFNGFEKPIIIS
jgi:ornithine decarboxylase